MCVHCTLQCMWVAHPVQVVLVIVSSQHLLSQPHSLSGAVLGGLLCAVSWLGGKGIDTVRISDEEGQGQCACSSDCRQAKCWLCVTCTHMLGRTVY